MHSHLPKSVIIGPSKIWHIFTNVFQNYQLHHFLTTKVNSHMSKQKSFTKRFWKLTLKVKKCSIVMNQSSFCQLFKHFLESMNRTHLVLSLNLENFQPCITLCPIVYLSKVSKVCLQRKSISPWYSPYLKYMKKMSDILPSRYLSCRTGFIP